jgi:hypothetical protein
MGASKIFCTYFFTLYSIWKQEKNNLKNFQPSFSISTNETFSFFMGISSLPLASQNNLCHIILDLKKYPKSISRN